MEDMPHVRTHEAQMEDVKEWDDDFFWNFQVGPEGGNLVVKNISRTLDLGDEDVLVKGVSLTIPPDALRKEITVTVGISWVKSDIPNNNQFLVGPAVYCLPSDLHFERPVKLSFHFESMFHNTVDVAMLSRNKTSGQWKKLGSLSTRMSDGTTVCSILTDCVSLTTVRRRKIGMHGIYPEGAGASRDSMKWVDCSVRWKHVYSKLQKKSQKKLVRGLRKINVSTTPYFTIGRGTSNTDVYLGLLDDGREMAVKKVAKSHKAERINEGEILVQLDHRNIVSYMTQEKADGHIYTALRLCDYTLDEWLRTAVVEPDWNRMAAEMVKQLLQALKYLHDNRVLHCDLTPQNVLVKDDKERCLKLGDFGLSCRVPSLASCAAKPAGTRSWQAREVLLCPPQLCCYSASSDIQEAGMVVFYMMSQRIHPYGATVLADVERNIINDNPDLSAVTDRIALDLVRPMLAANTADRPTAETLLRHPYVWTDERKYEFLAFVGDEREVATCDMTNATSAAIEAVGTTVLPLLAGRRDWGGLSVLPELNAQFQRQCQRSGYRESVCRLLRTLRNIKSHYGEQPARAKAILGHTPSPFTYFNTELPDLFPEIYSIIKNSKSSPDDWTQRELLKKFF